jgi:hypothetical protein
MCSDFEAASVRIAVCNVRVSAQVVEESVQLLCVIDDFKFEIRSFFYLLWYLRPLTCTKRNSLKGICI